MDFLFDKHRAVVGDRVAGIKAGDLPGAGESRSGQQKERGKQETPAQRLGFGMVQKREVATGSC